MITNYFTYVHNWSLQPFSLVYDLASHTTYSVCVYFIYESFYLNLESVKNLIFIIHSRTVSIKIKIIDSILLFQFIPKKKLWWENNQILWTAPKKNTTCHGLKQKIIKLKIVFFFFFFVLHFVIVWIHILYTNNWKWKRFFFYYTSKY